MFAHSAFEREVRSLQGAITHDQSFGERRSNQWKARERPERMAKLIKTHRGDDFQEAEPILKLLSDAISPTDERNFLASSNSAANCLRLLVPLRPSAASKEVGSLLKRPARPSTFPARMVVIDRASNPSTSSPIMEPVQKFWRSSWPDR
jgi:hypothetical protein